MKAGSSSGRQMVGTVALVEPPVSQWYIRRAKVAALVVGLALDVLVTAVLSVFYPLWLAVALGAASGVVCAVVAAVLVRIWPVARVLWWWSFEITAVTLVATGWVVLAHAATWWIASVVLLAVTVAVLVPGRSRRFVWAWSWCLVVRHRLRLCFATLVRSQSRVQGSPPPALPLLLWARPTHAGERVWLWLRPGFALESLEGKGPLIAVACYAKQVRMSGASERNAALVRVDITRRDPLTNLVDSPLALLIPSLRHSEEADVPVSPAVPQVGLDFADIDEPPAPSPMRGGRR
ncbi:hypothetical protein [Paractinoplanes atraurantiacus]|uniref:Uncharacterized protein n=1 Tax=Paractinoplanes atraurantiacus TaxID=1036182 RepID=A0A285FE61_9ACTN|nr:hypothetical protein [Actinoplanes atraurantiacus]SNY09605.1 hypothetical protein SAMN05421748_101892 [Actinoplanes atraurantiacus]